MPHSHSGLTAVDGLLVGQTTRKDRPTGCTVVVAPDGAVAGVDVRGAAPGTRETDLLDPACTVRDVHGLVLSGGSAFGLEVATGVVRYLEEHGIGLDVGVGTVPIVPAAVLFDLTVGNDPTIRPDAEDGYRAASHANNAAIQEGSVGAGAGATVGKLGTPRFPMRGGLGTASIELDNGTVVAALMAVNALGDVVDPATGAVVAGALDETGRLLDIRQHLRAGSLARPPIGQSTTVGVVATNATLHPAEAKRLAQSAHDGLARAVYPAHTPFDGDTIFALATGRQSISPDATVVGALAAEVTATAVLRAVRAATRLTGSLIGSHTEIPAVCDLAE